MFIIFFIEYVIEVVFELFYYILQFTLYRYIIFLHYYNLIKSYLINYIKIFEEKTKVKLNTIFIFSQHKEI